MSKAKPPSAAPLSRPPRRKNWLYFFVLVVVALLVWSLFPPEWPGADAEPLVPQGFVRKCEVTRDTFDVPHIKAATQEAAMYCWGRIHAMDRGWQMDYLRRRAYGRMAEVYGMKYAKGDFQMRILNLESIADRWILHYQRKDSPTLKLLRYYTWGVNDGFAKLKDPVYRPYIWKQLRYHPPGWRIRDTMMISILQSFYQTQRTFLDDLKHERLRVKLGALRYQQIFRESGGLRALAHTILKPGEHPLLPGFQGAKGSKQGQLPPSPRRGVAPRPAARGASSQPASRPRQTTRRPTPITKPTTRSAPTQTPGKPLIRLPHSLPRPQAPPAGRRPALDRQPTPRRSQRTPRDKARLARLEALHAMFAPQAKVGGGSNNWVVGPTRSASGHALLANDPHLSIGTPSFWHEVHIQAPGIDVLGIGVPGAPAIVSGNNRHVAWGITNGFSNAADLIRIRPNHKRRFKLGKKTYQIHTFRPVVWIKRGPIHFPVFWKSFARTPLGPILPLGSRPGEMILLRWSGYHIQKPPLHVPLLLMKARNVQEMDKAFQSFTLPCWNFVFADTAGGIGYRQVGLVARRAKGTRGLVDGSDPEQQWRGFLKPHEMPHLLNPGRGFIATANNHAFPKGYPHYLGQGYIIGHRAKQIETLIQQTPKHTPDTMKQIQTDIVVPMARLLLPKMLELVARETLPKTEEVALAILKGWDYRADRDAVAPTIFRVWVRNLEAMMFKDDIVDPNLPHSRTQERSARQAAAFRPGDAALIAALAGKLELSRKLSLGEFLRKSLQQTIHRLTQDLGADIKRWQWGRYHKVAFFHMLDKRIPWKPPAQPMHGGEETVSPALLSGEGPYIVRNAASYRLIVELQPGKIRSWGVLAGKNIDSKPRKLGKQQRLWLDHKYRPRPYYPDEIKKHRKSSRVISF